MRAFWGHFALSFVLIGNLAGAVGGSDGPTPWFFLFTTQCWVGPGPEGRQDAGFLYARDTRSLREECGFVARQRFGERGKSEVGRPALRITRRKVHGDCFIGPCGAPADELVLERTLSGLGSFPLRRECLRIAADKLGEGAQGDLRKVRLGP